MPKVESGKTCRIGERRESSVLAHARNVKQACSHVASTFRVSKASIATQTAIVWFLGKEKHKVITDVKQIKWENYRKAGFNLLDVLKSIKSQLGAIL